MPPLKKNEKMMLALIGAALVVFIAMDPYFLIWKKPPDTGKKGAKGAAPAAAAAQVQPAAQTTPAAVESAPAGTGRRSTIGATRVPYETWKRDPFTRTRAYLEETYNLAQFKLGAISVRQEDRYALINSRIVREGDQIGGMTVDRIERNQVILVAGGRSYTLSWEE